MRNAPTSSSLLSRKVVSSEMAKRKRNRYTPRNFLECQSITHVLKFPPQHEILTTPVVSNFVKELFLDRFVKEIVTPFLPNKKTTKKSQHGREISKSIAEANAGHYHVMVDGKLVKRRRISQDIIQPKSTTTETTFPQSSQNDEGSGDADIRRKIWKEHIVVGTNQCLRMLENFNTAHFRDNNIELESIHKSTRDSVENSSGAKNTFRKPSLVVIARDIYPPTMCCAVPVLAKRLGIPILILPGKASLELGRALNAKRTSILIFCCSDENGGTGSTDTLRSDDCPDKHVLESSRAIASFVSFVKDQIPETDN